MQGIASLNGTNTWATISPTIQATNTSTDYCVLLPSSYHFFRVVEGLALDMVSAPAANLSVVRNGGGYLLQWAGPVWAHYQVQWTTNLASGSWNTFSGVVTSTTGTFSFLDDGSQTGGLGAQRFYRVVQVP